MFEFPIGWILNLHICSDVFITVDFTKTIEGEVSDIGNIELMVSFEVQ